MRDDVFPNNSGTTMTINEESPLAQELASGKAMQQVRSTYCTAVAVQKPRDLVKVERALLAEARLAGEDFYYGWGAGQNKIEGPSVSLALAAARCYGNCAVDTLPVQDLADGWVFTASFIDLESGFTLTRQFRQSKKSAVHGKHDAERKDDIRFQVGQSKALRNVVLNSVPTGLINRALEAAKSGVKQRIELFIAQKGLPAAVDMLLRALLKQGVTEPRILAKFGLADRKALMIEHLITLRGDLSALEQGQDRPEELFPVVQQNGGPVAGKAEAAPEQPAPTAPAAKKSSAKRAKLLDEQLAKLTELRGKLEAAGVPDEGWARYLATYGVDAADKLDTKQAALLIGRIESDLEEMDVSGMTEERQPGEDQDNE